VLFLLPAAETTPVELINAIPIERVTNFKLLGVMISSDLSWEAHVHYMLGKVAKRMFCIHYLVRAGV